MLYHSIEVYITIAVRASNPNLTLGHDVTCLVKEVSGWGLSVRPITALSQETGLGKFQILPDYRQTKLPNKSNAQTRNMDKLNRRVSAKVAYGTRLL
jgi:hypothetical protein